MRDPRYKRSYMSAVHFHHNHVLYPLLAEHGGMKRNLDGSTSMSVLADAGLDPVRVEVAPNLFMTVAIKSKAQAAREAAETKAGLVYRVWVCCSHCCSWVPAAKMGQHYLSKKCQQ